MKGMGHGEENHRDKTTVELHRCPECGFEYREKEWAEKCEVWCKKYKSCNLEITKQAIKTYE